MLESRISGLLSTRASEKVGGIIAPLASTLRERKGKWLTYLWKERFNTSLSARPQAAVATLEKKLADERKQKTEFQIKLETERKIKKEAANAERTAQQNQTRSEVLRIEAEIKTLRSELQGARERYTAAEQEVYVLRKYKASFYSGYRVALKRFAFIVLELLFSFQLVWSREHLCVHQRTCIISSFQIRRLTVTQRCL